MSCKWQNCENKARWSGFCFTHHILDVDCGLCKTRHAHRPKGAGLDMPLCMACYNRTLRLQKPRRHHKIKKMYQNNLIKIEKLRKKIEELKQITYWDATTQTFRNVIEDS